MTGMYNSFFGFRERPFQLVPNPAYLFLSRSHEEAMAHLIYAISQGDGFAEITGEVGTGKTTLCRALLENLDKFTEAAYIFNPKLDALQLLKAINDELGIPSEADTTKALIDTLNAFLIKRKAEGKRVLLIIDEAQNLSKDVLEQLRLLSNLETTTSKLLQIILVGQPELAEMLDSYELRQLGQRIALSCHLSPLTYRETKEYIQHRIQLASQKPEVRFTPGACRAIYKYSGGIPRLINIACERALLTAFGLNSKRVTGIIAKASIRELADRGYVRSTSSHEGRRMPLSLGLVLGAFVAVLYLATIFLIIHRSVDMRVNTLLESRDLERPKVTQRVEGGKGRGEDSFSVQASTGPQGSVDSIRRVAEADGQGNLKARETKEESVGVREPSTLAVGSVEELLQASDHRHSRSDAIKAVLELWTEEPDISALLNEMEDDQSFFRIVARQNGLQILEVRDDPELLRKLNLPALLRLQLPGGRSPRYLALLKMDSDGIVVNAPEPGARQWVLRQISPLWSGVAYVPWRNFSGYNEILPHGATGEAVLSVKAFLRELGYGGVDMGPVYDERTVTVIRGIQAKHGLVTDGVIGPLTRIALFNEQASLTIPRLSE